MGQGSMTFILVSRRVAKLNVPFQFLSGNMLAFISPNQITKISIFFCNKMATEQPTIGISLLSRQYIDWCRLNKSFFKLFVWFRINNWHAVLKSTCIFKVIDKVEIPLIINFTLEDIFCIGRPRDYLIYCLTLVAWRIHYTGWFIKIY